MTRNALPAFRRHYGKRPHFSFGGTSSATGAPGTPGQGAPGPNAPGSPSIADPYSPDVNTALANADALDPISDAMPAMPIADTHVLSEEEPLSEMSTGVVPAGLGFAITEPSPQTEADAIAALNEVAAWGQQGFPTDNPAAANVEDPNEANGAGQGDEGEGDGSGGDGGGDWRGGFIGHHHMHDDDESDDGRYLALRLAHRQHGRKGYADAGAVLSDDAAIPEISTADIIRHTPPPSPQERGEVPFYGPNDEYIDRPAATPGRHSLPWPLTPLDEPGKSILGLGQGLMLSSGMTGAPAGTVTGAVKYGIENLPKAPTALGALLTGALANTSRAGDEGPALAGQSAVQTGDALKKLYEQQGVLLQQQKEALARRETFRPVGRRPTPQQDPQFTQAAGEYDNLTTQLGAVNKLIQHNEELGSPEHLEQLRRDQALYEKAQQEKRAATPTRELYSDYMPYLPAVAGTLALLGGAALRGRSLANFNEEIADISQRWLGALQRAQVAPNSAAGRAAVWRLEDYRENTKRSGAHTALTGILVSERRWRLALAWALSKPICPKRSTLRVLLLAVRYGSVSRRTCWMIGQRP
jgi:hypothetical protein